MRNSPAKTDGNFPPMMHTPYADVVFGFLDQRFRPLRGAEKLLARVAGCTPRTARGWLDHQHAPQGEHLLSLMAACDDLAADISKAVEERRCQRSSSKQPGAGPASAEAQRAWK